ncbi:MFS transporter [Sphingomonas koreensis]|nr:MFS transporter [Sphingomonas koreensis]
MAQATASASGGLSKRQIAAVVAGNGLEFYDFLTYAFFATQIGSALFPGSADNKLLLSLATFGVGFVTRPLGGVIIGRIADRKGRKPAMILSFALMGVAIVGLALTPSYAAIGMAAPVMAVIFRMLQGFALGGEVGPNTAFLVEAAPPGRRALYVSLQYATQDMAVLASGTIGLILSSTLTPAALGEWGWRLAFLIGATIVPFGLWVRRSLAETLVAEADQIETGAGGRSVLAIAIAGLLLLMGGTIGNYTLDYMTTFAQNSLHMAVNTAFGATVVLGVTSVIADLISGWLADRYGRKRTLVVPWLLLFVLSIPAFLVIVHFRTGTALLSMTALLSILLALAMCPALTLFTESLPARVRAGAMGTVYALSIAIFGGSAQLVEQALIKWTGNPMAPAFYMTAALGVGVIGILILKEEKRDRRSGTPTGHLDPALLS